MLYATCSCNDFGHSKALLYAAVLFHNTLAKFMKIAVCNNVLNSDKNLHKTYLLLSHVHTCYKPIFSNKLAQNVAISTGTTTKIYYMYTFQYFRKWYTTAVISTAQLKRVILSSIDMWFAVIATIALQPCDNKT